MVQISPERPETTSEQGPFSAEAWAQTPVEVQEFIRVVLARLQALELEAAESGSNFSETPVILPSLPPVMGLGLNRHPREPRVDASGAGNQDTRARPEN
jgi:hypothetical protein